MKHKYRLRGQINILHRKVKPSSRHRNKPKQTAKEQKTTAEIQCITNIGKILHFLTLPFSFPDFFVVILLRGLKRATKATKEHGKIERTYSVEETAAQDREHQSIP